MPESYFDAGRHDTSDKQLSYHFNNDVVSDGGIEEYSMVIDRIFQQPAVARYICQKLYRHFVYYKVDETVENEVVNEMARIFEENDFEIRPVLRALFLSEHFYDMDNQGPMIKNPLQLVGGLKRSPALHKLKFIIMNRRNFLRTGGALSLPLFANNPLSAGLAKTLRSMVDSNSDRVLVLVDFPTGFPSEDNPHPFAVAMGNQVSQTCQGEGANYSMAITDPFNLLTLAGGDDTPLPQDPYGDELGFLRTS